MDNLTHFHCCATYMYNFVHFAANDVKDGQAATGNSQLTVITT